MSSNTTIRKVSYAAILDADNAQALIGEYAAECSIPLLGRINPQPRIYEALERSGMLQCFGVFQGEQLIGFAAVLASILPHYGRFIATVESLFMASTKRKGGTGRALMLAVEDHAIKSGCEAILYSAPAQSQFDRYLDASTSYSLTNHVYCRELV